MYLLAEKYYSISPYAYCANNPVNRIDPTGMFDGMASSHTDENGEVIAVYNDGDLGVYKHKGGKIEATAEVNANYSSSNTSAGGKKVGETYYWDEFLAEGHGNNRNDIILQARIDEIDEWDDLIEELHAESLGLNTLAVGFLSRSKGRYDIKANKSWAKYGAGTMKKMGGKYISARSAGNYLAGLNGAGRGMTFANYMQIAGALHALGVNATFAAAVLTGSTYGPSPWYGEIDYAGRMITRGWLSNPQANDINRVRLIFNLYCK